MRGRARRGGDSHLDQLSPSLLGRGQGSALSGSPRSVGVRAQRIADPAALNRHGFNPGARRCLQESGRILEAAGCVQGGWEGDSARCSSVVLPGGLIPPAEKLLQQHTDFPAGSMRLPPGPCCCSLPARVLVRVSPHPSAVWM